MRFCSFVLFALIVSAPPASSKERVQGRAQSLRQALNESARDRVASTQRYQKNHVSQEDVKDLAKDLLAGSSYVRSQPQRVISSRKRSKRRGHRPEREESYIADEEEADMELDYDLD